MAKQQVKKDTEAQNKTEQSKQVEAEKSKIGQGAAKAWLRQGGKELDQVWAAFPANSSMQIVQESGNIWNPPSMDVSNQTGATKRAAKVRDNMNAKKTEAPKAEAKVANQQEQKPRDIEPEMDPG